MYVTHKVSRKSGEIRASELSIDDPRLPEQQATEHAEHARIAFSNRRKQMTKKATDKPNLISSEDRARIIDLNAMHLAEKVRAISILNAHKRKARVAEPTCRKRRKITFGKYQIRKRKQAFSGALTDEGGKGDVCTHTSGEL
ncbi:hypothetical protein PSTT_00265 [Puccinia striiformis]|uniref:Uncharacterized protein n=1 Tax=Puccinia striiformis TaxID=27350 RepID=A0A2S4W825_9BASI|nr:hypothetical protein PSTT_00265 [Puccinia striiformis]